LQLAKHEVNDVYYKITNFVGKSFLKKTI